MVIIQRSILQQLWVCVSGLYYITLGQTLRHVSDFSAQAADSSELSENPHQRSR